MNLFMSRPLLSEHWARVLLVNGMVTQAEFSAWFAIQQAELEYKAYLEANALRDSQHQYDMEACGGNVTDEEWNSTFDYNPLMHRPKPNFIQDVAINVFLWAMTALFIYMLVCLLLDYPYLWE